jgi:hypothetical protein
MVHNTIDFVNELVHTSLQKLPIQLSTTHQLLTTTSLNKTRIVPLMAQPYEVVNVTTGDTGSTQDGTKPPDKPNG